MAMSGKLKLGLLAFVLVDLMLVVTFVSLYLLRSERELVAEMRELGLTIYPDAQTVQAFSLTDEQGNSFDEVDLAGYWNFFFFGFTACPDICPITMTELKQFYSGLNQAEQAQARVIMVSVDPARDDVDTLAEYVDSFNAEFVGLTGNIGVIAGLAEQFFVAHSKPSPVSHDAHTTTDVAQEYLIEHSGHLAIVDPEGRFAAVMRSPVRDGDVTNAYRHLLASY